MPPIRSSAAQTNESASGSSNSRQYTDGNTDTDGHGENDDHEDQTRPLSDPNFDILEWHPAYQSCQKFFLDHAQHEHATQAVCALINIRLPCQRLDRPIVAAHPVPPSSTAAAPSPTAVRGDRSPFATFSAASSSAAGIGSPSSRGGESSAQQPLVFVSLIPYIRRLVVTNFDKPAILHGFFGDDFVAGVMPHVQCERRNYLFAAKHGGWRSCKKQYDVGSGLSDGDGGDESVPFMKPLDETDARELGSAEKAWSDWLAMEDWMVGPHAPSARTSLGSSTGRTAGGHRRQQSGGMRDSGMDGIDGYRE